MYNPFKWHIIKYRGRFLLRKYSLFLGWRYLDRKDAIEWKNLGHGWKWSGWPNLTDAQMLLSTLKVERV